MKTNKSLAPSESLFNMVQQLETTRLKTLDFTAHHHHCSDLNIVIIIILWDSISALLYEIQQGCIKIKAGQVN